MIDQAKEALDSINPFDSFNIKAEDFFKSVDEIKKQHILNDSEEDKLFETKTSLCETDYMICDKCKDFNIRVKMSNEGFLFSACMGFPKCKNAYHTMPKCVRNL